MCERNNFSAQQNNIHLLDNASVLTAYCLLHMGENGCSASFYFPILSYKSNVVNTIFKKILTF